MLTRFKIDLKNSPARCFDVAGSELGTKRASLSAISLVFRFEESTPCIDIQQSITSIVTLNLFRPLAKLSSAVNHTPN